MTKALPLLLEYGFAGNAKRKELSNKEYFKKGLEGVTCRSPNQYKSFGLENPYERMDGYKALIQSEADAINDSTLVQEEVYKTIIQGTEPVRCMREVIPVVNTGTYSVRFVKGEDASYADKVAEGAAIPIDTEKFTKQDITVDKYGTRPVITNELIDDGLFDIVGQELMKAGERMENRLNREVLNKILNGTNKITTNTQNPEGTHIAVSDLALAVAKIKKQNFIPDYIVTHPTAEGYLLQDSNLAYVSYAGQSSSLTGGTVPKLMGLTPRTCTATDSSSPTWDDTTAGSDVTAFAFSKKDLATIVMRNDISIERYEDPIHDLVGISLLMRYGTDVLKEKAGCIIYHK